MVRLRSNRWYSAENQYRLGRRTAAQSAGTRRLISLIFLLALVVLLMQKAGDPKYVRRAFESLGVPLEREIVASSAHPARGQADSIESTDAPDHRTGWLAPPQAITAAESTAEVDDQLLATCRDLTPRVLDRLTADQLDALAEFWFTAGQSDGFAPNDRAELVTIVDQQVQQAVDQLQPTATDQAWRQHLESYAMHWGRLLSAAAIDEAAKADAAEADAAEDRLTLRPEFRQALTAELDRRLLGSLRDGSPWLKSDTLGFWRLLHRAASAEWKTAVDPPLLATQSLEADYGAYRGLWIRFRGTVHRLQPIHRSHAGLGISGYWLLWLRGADQASQPIAVYTTDDWVARFAEEVADDRWPEIEVLALVGKRLAYGSAAGVQVAPTLFAGSIIQFTSDVPLPPAPRPRELLRQLLTAAVAALLISGLILLPIWRSYRRRRPGPVRAASRSSQLLMLLALWPTAAAVRAQTTLPPWTQAASSDQAFQEIAQLRLSDVLRGNDLGELEAVVADSAAALPDGLLRMMFALNQLGWQRLQQLELPLATSDHSSLVPAHLQGWATAIESLALSASQREWFSTRSIRQIYRLTVQVDSAAAELGPQPTETATVFCLQAPRSWLDSERLRQAVQIRGWAVQSREPADAPSVDQAANRHVCYLCEAPIWLASQTTTAEAPPLSPELSPTWRRLGAAGWNLAWSELIAANDQRGITAAEAEPFWRLMEIAARDGMDAAEQPVQPLDVIRSPSVHLGAVVDWKVRLVTGHVLEMQPSAEDSRRYFQFDGFVKIPGQRVDYTLPDQQGTITFEGEFPVTLVMDGESEFVPSDRVASGERTWSIGRHARATGRFYRLWSYRSQRLEAAGSDARQVAPLVMLSRLEPAKPDPPPPSPVGWFGLALGAGIVLIMGGILISVFRDRTRRLRR